MHRSVITNLIGSICSPHLRSVSLVLGSEVEEVEHFPWEVVNNLVKALPHMLQRVEVALRLQQEEYGNWIPTPPGEYEGYFHQVRSALPGLDKKLIMRIASQAVRHSLLCLLLISPPYYHQLSQCRIRLIGWYVE